MARDIRELGYFYGRDSETVKIRYSDNNDADFKILKYNEFDSVRKCASIVVEGQDGQVIVYVKGSDSTLLKMLSSESNCKVQLERDIDDFASKGLRTLVFAYKEIISEVSINEETNWDEVLIENVESNLQLLGATGVEDLLQENV